MSEDEKYMARCLQLAQNGFSHATPNPMVGAVIVHNHRIIGEGYHIRCGKAHAEVNAIRSVKENGLLQKSCLYVSLEPCSHYGKTPPCADLIIDKQIPRVVVGCIDPFAKVSGRGIQKLQDAGIEVTTGVLEKECLQLNRRFITFNKLKRPYITLKWAESANGYIDLEREGGHPYVLSNPLTQMLVHKKRAENKSILVGRHTAQLDNPSLTVRSWQGENPIRLVIDRHLSLPNHLQLFNEEVATWIFTEKKGISCPNKEYIQLDFQQNILPQILTVLYERNIQTLLVEGGQILLQSFLDTHLWDEIFIERTPALLPSGIKAPLCKTQEMPDIESHFGSTFFHYIQSHY